MGTFFVPLCTYLDFCTFLYIFGLLYLFGLLYHLDFCTIWTFVSIWTLVYGLFGLYGLDELFAIDLTHVHCEMMWPCWSRKVIIHSHVVYVVTRNLVPVVYQQGNRERDGVQALMQQIIIPTILPMLAITPALMAKQVLL
jgi:hypothetical protein